MFYLSEATFYALTLFLAGLTAGVGAASLLAFIGLKRGWITIREVRAKDSNAITART